VSLPAPRLFDLPERFAEWRPEQERAIFEFLDAEERFITLCLPTGSGKSLLPVAVSKIQDLRACILTSTKVLQDQYNSDFTTLLRDLRGRGNYRCKALQPGGQFYSEEFEKASFVSVESGPCNAGVECGLKEIGCDYFDAVREAKQAQIVITNYSKWLTADIERELGKFDLLVLDEAHAAPDELADALSTELEYWEVESLIGGNWPKLDSMRDWMLWAATSGEVVRLAIDSLSAEIRNRSGRVRRELVTEARNLRALEKKLNQIAKARGQWIVDDLVKVNAKGQQHAAGVRFDPVWPAPYAEEKLFRGTPKVMLTSATVRPKTLEILGVGMKESKFIEYPSSFPVARRPIYFVPTVRMSHKTTDRDIEKLIERIDEIIDTRYDKRILIHTVSYARRNLILTQSKHKAIMLSHSPSEMRETVERFKTTEPPVVLVSPSVSTGVDFPYESCEVIIIVKVPFPDMRSKVLKARVLSDREYGNYLAAQELVQATGRGMRAVDDRCETLIIDSHAGWFVWSRKSLFPKYFLNAFRKAEFLPKPLPKL